MSDGICVGDTVQVADDLHGFGSFIGTRGIVTIVYEDGTVVFEAGEGLGQTEYRFPRSSLSKPCTYCDLGNGNGPTGIGMLGGRCPRCSGSKVEA